MLNCFPQNRYPNILITRLVVTISQSPRIYLAGKLCFLHAEHRVYLYEELDRIFWSRYTQLQTKHICVRRAQKYSLQAGYIRTRGDRDIVTTKIVMSIVEHIYTDR